ncbi:hypothetical protein GLX27_000688 [Malassezia furfur]|uniref:alanine--glyoxylate transaminase n=1 Tax=Malassezia furfur TaxID=55194 RepID=A0ABY8EKA5_MALFU|nr:hypothetical protein CBS14141_001641 [Malassezia furfur]WFD46060.1 hypothetical protein GLX27_000688 [Malassezia furfur]
MSFKQAPHDLLMVPGFIEFTDEVLWANAHPAVGLISDEFVSAFGEVLAGLRRVMYASKDSQPVVLSGSGNMGWDLATLNILEPGDDVLVLQTGHFSDLWEDSLLPYGINVTKLTAPVGERPSIEEIKEALKQKKYRAITITQVDTSTGVLSDVKTISAATHEVSPETLVFVDGVCSVGAEELRVDEWGIDFVLTAPQQGLGCPPGVSIILMGPRALKAFEERKAPVESYFLSLKRWIPVMRSFEGGKLAFLATPPTNLIFAMQVSLRSMLDGPVSLEERFEKTKQASAKVKSFVAEMGLQQLVSEELQRTNGAANSMTTVRYPKGITAADIVPKMAERGVVIGGGIHSTCKDDYFRIGHIGVSVTDESRGDVDKVLTNLREVLAEAGYKP